MAADNPRIFVPPPLIFAGLLSLGLVLDRQPISVGGVQILGVALAVIGLALIAVALGLFRAKKTRPEPWQPASALVEHGIYRFTRNPMYLGMALLALGLSGIFMSLAGALAALLAALIVDRAVIPREEAYLNRRFGGEYSNYRQRVRRWL